MKKLAAFVAAIVGAACLSSASAQAPTTPDMAPTAKIETRAIPTPPVTAAQVGTPALTATDLNAWLDGFMPYAIGKGDIPGAVVVVVKDGQLLTSRGYGYADVAKHTKVDPATTLFRPGSISKLFTWTALMQQVEQGKVDLNGDVNQYIDFKIPPYQGKPVTVLNLMTHTPGFEEQVKDLITTTPKDYVQFDALLKRWVPKRIYAPGTTPAYSNYGASLAGYIVQRVSGEPFDAYVARHIFAPLGMQHATFTQPVPANLKPLLAEGYVSGKDKPYGYEFVSAAPAGSLSASGEDMAKFMIAHLQNGQYNGQRILQPATAQLMHSRANTPFKDLDGMAHGFYETNINGLHVIAHGGDTVAFHSDLHLFLDKNTGIFVSFNSAGKQGAAGPLRQEIFEQFADRYFPAPANAARKVDPNGAKADAEKLAGVYSTTRGSSSNFLNAVDLIGQSKVTVDSDGNPVIGGASGLNGQPRKWLHIGPMLWKAADDGHELLEARVADGKAWRFSYGELAPIIDFDRTPGYRSSAWILPLLYASLAVLLVTLLLWPTRALVRRRYKTTLPYEGRPLWAYRSSRISAIAILAVLIGWIVLMQMLFGDLANADSLNPLLLPLQLLSLVVFVGGFAVMLWYAYTAWRSNWSWQAKLWSIVLVIASGTVLYVGLVFKLIGFATNY
jgi:CubicO group peptidase (beta-lactamase class C family)